MLKRRENINRLIYTLKDVLEINLRITIELDSVVLLGVIEIIVFHYS